jgi:hypothetical protein
MLVRVGKIRPRFQLQIWDGEQQLLSEYWRPPESTSILPTTDTLVLAIGEKLPLKQAARLCRSAQGERFEVVTVPEGEPLPTDSLAFDGVDGLFISDNEDSRLSSLTARQWATIREYVQFGGRLIFSVDGSSQSVFEQQPVIRDLMDVDFRGTLLQTMTTGLEAFAGGEHRLDLIARRENRDWTGVGGTRLEPENAKTLVSDGAGESRVDWVIQGNSGLGIVTLVACNLEQPTILAWPSLPRFLARLMEVTVLGDATDQPLSIDRRVSHVGFDDLAGQVRMALDQFDRVRRVSLSTVMMLILLYVALVGIGDYAFLWWSGDRFLWTWWSMPVIVGATCGVAILLSQAWKGAAPRVNQLEIVDISPEAKIARGRILARYYSPFADTLDISARPRSRVLPIIEGRVLSSWQGLPGTGLGGMSSRVSTASTSSLYRHIWRDDSKHVRLTLEDVGLAAGASWGLSCEWQVRNLDMQIPKIEADAQEMLAGTIVNPLPIRLRDCGLCFSRWYYDLGSLDPGSQLTLDRGSDVKDMLSHLVRRRIVQEKEVMAPWNKLQTELGRLAEMVMFYSAAKGRDYTGLHNHYLSRLDLTDTMRLRAAVLVGRAERPITDVEITTQSSAPTQPDRTATFVRILIPVHPRRMTSSANPS